MDDTVDGLNGVLHIRDDFIVYGCNDKEHDEALESLLRECGLRECGLMFNPKKCKFRIPDLDFFGYVFSSEGVKPSPTKVQALKKINPPKNAAEVRSLLAVAQYSDQFIPGLSEIDLPIFLTHKNANWKWSREEQKSFQVLQDALSCDSVIEYYEIGQETKLKVDAGPSGLGLVIQQKKGDQLRIEQWLLITPEERMLQTTFRDKPSLQ